jgi:RHS repeat-associated protein
MSDKSGTSPQAITLPTGGGAVHGVGETFSPDLFTGTGKLIVPIAVPVGRNGLQPRLELVYSSGYGNGPFGLGWELAVPGIRRHTSRGVPRYRDDERAAADQDTYVLSGDEELVPGAEPQPGVQRFRPRVEAAFARIDRVRTAGDDYWAVATRDGLVSRYGTPLRGGDDPAVVVDPAAPAHVFEWKLAETTDPFGNRIEYEYGRDRVSEGPRRWDQSYLERVRYVDYEEGGATRFLVSVTFLYEERPDPFSDYRAGFEIRTRRRARRVEIRTHAGNDAVAHTIELAYLDDLVAAGERPASDLPRNGASMLARVTVVGHDGTRTQALPPLEFGYTTFAPERQRFQAIEAAGGALPPVSLADGAFETVDLTGNGLPDIVEVNGSVRLWHNEGGGRYARPEPMDTAPAGVELADPGVQFADMNGDGRTDLLTLPLGGYFPLGRDGDWSRDGFVAYPAAPAVSFGADDIRLVDLDGDGVIDALRTGTELELFFNDPERGWDRVETRPRRPLVEFPDVSFSDPRVKLADLDGDGLQDIVLVDDGRIDYWPYLGHGRWGRRVTMARSPVLRDDPPVPSGFDPRRVLLGDLDGDGVADLVYVQADRVSVWINQGGEGWSDPVHIDGTPPFSDIDGVRLIDMLGSGMAGVLWTSDAVPDGGDHYRFLDLTGGLKPYLLERTDNHRGAVTTVRYASSTSHYLADATEESTRWNTTLPFPVQVVDSVEVADAISGGALTRRYRYHDGHWDGIEREFRGFGLVEQHDSETFGGGDNEGQRFSPPLLTRTWFHLGFTGDDRDDPREHDGSDAYWADDPQALGHTASTDAFLATLPDRAARRDALRALRGSILRTELFAQDGSDRDDRPYTVTERAYGVREVDPPTDAAPERRRVFFPHLAAERTSHWERGTEPMTSLEFVDDYDEHGQPRRTVSLAVPRGRDFRAPAGAAEPYLGTITSVDHAGPGTDGAGRFIADRVARTTTREVLNDGSPSAFELRDAARSGVADLRVVAQEVTYYDGDAFVGLPLGRVGPFGAPVRRERLVLTEEVLADAVADGDTPPYLAPTDAPAWTDEYPPGFRDRLPPLAGYVFSAGDDGRARGYFAPEARHRYDFHTTPARARGLALVTRDPLGSDTTIERDRFDLMTVRATDEAGLVTEARYDYRALQPRLAIDANGNRTLYAFTPLGLVASIAVLGKPGDPVGDTAAAPSTRFVYDLTPTSAADLAPPRPVSVRTVRHVHRARGSGVPAPERDETVETLELSDGFGRLVQTRTQAEDVLYGDELHGRRVVPAGQDDPATQADVTGRRSRRQPHVVVSGWQVYDNKGRVVERYEPFFSEDWTFAPPTESELGERVTMFHDPRDRVVRSVNPDGSEERVVHGVLGDLDDPDNARPTPWETFRYDANDNAGATHGEDAGDYEHHWATPNSSVVDALGRTVVATERTRSPRPGPSAPLPPATDLITRTRYDIAGNETAVTDALGRVAVRYVHDLAGRRLRSESIDAGFRRTVLDASARPIEERDGKGALVLHAHDRLGRPAQRWARDDLSSAVTLREFLVYGDGGDPDQPAAEREAARAANRVGALERHYDEAGLTAVGAYDARGNVLERTRQVISDDMLLAAFPLQGDPAPDWRRGFLVDWTPPGGDTLDHHASRLLDPASHLCSFTYDALDRPRTITVSAGTDGTRQVLRYGYDRSGALAHVTLDDEVVVDRIARDARGRHTLVALGNGVMTRYMHDPRTARLVRLRAERYTRPGEDTAAYRPTGRPLQDLAYRHDLVGNILDIVDRVPGSGVASNPDALREHDSTRRAAVASGDALVRRFAYDPLYRVVAATGRECQGRLLPLPGNGTPGCGFDSPNHGTPDQDNAPHLTTTYRQQFDYDAVGNLVRSAHSSAATGSTRKYHLAPGTNRVGRLENGSVRIDYTYDGNGNLVGEGSSRHVVWDHADRMTAFRIQAGASEPSVAALYLYDSSGVRVKKLVRRQGGGHESTTYVDRVFELHRWGEGGANTVVRVTDGEQPIATVRRGEPHPQDRSPATQYTLGDHLTNASVTVDQDAAFVNREEYTVHGETTFGSFGRKRYRYGSQERDEESGLQAHGRRYMAPWLGRWISTDPAGPVDSPNLYALARGNPVRYADPGGMQSQDPQSPAGTDEAAAALRKDPKLLGPADEGITPADALQFIMGLPDNPLDIVSVGMHGGGMVSGEYFIGDKFLFAGSLLSLFTSEEPIEKVQAGLGVAEGSLGIAAEAAGFVGSEAIAARLAIGSSLAGFASAYLFIWMDMGQSRQKALEKAKLEGRQWGFLLGFATGSTGGDAQWIRNELVLRSNEAFDAARVRHRAFNVALIEGLDTAQSLAPEHRQAYVNAVIGYAARNGRVFTGFRDDYKNLVFGLASTTVEALKLGERR